MHDLLVTVGLVFFLTALIAILQMLRAARRTNLFLVGVICLILLIACAVMYYGNMLFSLLPVTQKLVFVLCIGWLLAVHLVQLTPREVRYA